MKKLSIVLLLIGSACLSQVHAHTFKMKDRNIETILNPTLDGYLADDSTLLNKPAPDFELRDLNDKIYSLKHLKGKIVVLNFWFINCKPCVNEMPVLNGIKNKYDAAKVVFLALSLDHKTAITAFLQSHKFEYTILPGAKAITETYGVYAYPASLVIDAQGTIRFIQVGGPNIGDNLSRAINAVSKANF